MVDWENLTRSLPPAKGLALARTARAALLDVRDGWAAVDALVLENQARVLAAMQQAGVAEHHFAGSTGYGLDDTGRAKLEAVFAAVFGAETALVRLQMASGTHAIALGLFAALRPGDELVSATGTPYDTLQPVIAGAPGSLAEWSVSYREVPLDPAGRVDLGALAAAIGPRTRVVFVQRSCGYAPRPSLTIDDIAAVVATVRAVRNGVAVVVDNCYGEFCAIREPLDVGADLICGSLIKNPGGGLAPMGGYVAGRRDLVERAAARLTAPGIGGEVGASLGWTRLLLQGLFLAPHVVGESLRGALFTAAFFRRLGLPVRPGPQEPRSDLIQAVELGSPEALLAFCRAVQAAAPVDSMLRPQAEPMPGYRDPVVMAAGTFVQGASIELSADGPLRPPYTAYFQGGLTREHVLIAAVQAAAALVEQGLITLAEE